MLSAVELEFIRGLVSDEEYPYYFVWQESDYISGYSYRSIHVYLSKDPIEVSSRAYTTSSDTLDLELVNDRLVRLNSNGESCSGSVPVDCIAYTNTSNTPYFADIYSSVSVSREVPFNIPLVVVVVFAASLVAGVVRSILFGGKS